MSAGLEPMRDVAEAHFQREVARIAPILAEETRIRADLARLAEHQKSARDAYAQGHETQYLGADLIWDAWLLRARKELNIELARVLARKARHMDAVRRSFGRKIALDEITAKDRADRRDRKAKAFLQGLIEARLTAER